jgi:hypothetical protein
MCFATAFYQRASRNCSTNPTETSRELHSISDRHYHYCLGFWPQLMKGTCLEDMQALAMLGSHARNFPKPEVGWAVMTVALARMTQLNYHRSTKAGQSWVSEKSFLEKEVRKRIFWTTFGIVMAYNGKLGRPMPFRYEDFDVEMPMAVCDEQITEFGLDESQKGPCHFLGAIEAYKLVPPFLNLYETLFAARKPALDPLEYVQKCEKRIQNWFDSINPNLQPIPTNPLTKIIYEYMKTWASEYRLLLYHPSLSLSKSPKINEANLRKCMEAARQMMEATLVLKEYRSLDSPWYNSAIYVLAIQTMLYGHHQFRDELDQQKFDQLKFDMNTWLSILEDIGLMNGK